MGRYEDEQPQLPVWSACFQPRTMSWRLARTGNVADPPEDQGGYYAPLVAHDAGSCLPSERHTLVRDSSLLAGTGTSRVRPRPRELCAAHARSLPADGR